MTDVSASNKTETIANDNLTEDGTHVSPPTVPMTLLVVGPCYLCTLSEGGTPSEWSLCDTCATQLEQGNKTLSQSQDVAPIPSPIFSVVIPAVDPCYMCTLSQGGTPIEWTLCDNCAAQLEKGKNV